MEDKWKSLDWIRQDTDRNIKDVEKQIDAVRKILDALVACEGLNVGAYVVNSALVAKKMLSDALLDLEYVGLRAVENATYLHDALKTKEAPTAAPDDEIPF